MMTAKLQSCLMAVALVGLIGTSQARGDSPWLARMIATAMATPAKAKVSVENTTKTAAMAVPTTMAVSTTTNVASTADCGAPACGEPVVVSCAPAIIYNHVCVNRVCCCRCEPPIQTVLSVTDPACCTACPVAIPICLPSCCTGAPTVCCWTGLFGRGVVRYDYCCGLSIKIVFRNCGDIVVTYIGA
jgi:hypothetical protein